MDYDHYSQYWVTFGIALGLQLTGNKSSIGMYWQVNFKSLTHTSDMSSAVLKSTVGMGIKNSEGELI